MLGRRLSLAEFVACARDRVMALHGSAVSPWCDRAPAEEVAEEAVRMARAGLFFYTSNISYPYDLYVPEGLWESLVDLDECPAWMEFHEACLTAERIDSFLAVLERAGVTAQVARDCRDDLDLLLVLADWCVDSGLPRSAAEARHLHRLVCERHQG
jgi:hypothetical protein